MNQPGKTNITEETKILFKRKLHEENLLHQRLTVFILATTVFLLTFTQAHSGEIQVAEAISVIGIFACVIAFIHGLRTKHEMDRIDKKLCELFTNPDKEKVKQCSEIMGIRCQDFPSQNIFSGRSIFLWLSMIFGGLWGFIIWDVFSAPCDWWVWAFVPPIIFIVAWFICK